MTDETTAKLIKEWEETVKTVFLLEQDLKEAKEQLRQYEVEIIPAQLDRLGYNGIKLANGKTVSIEESVYTTLVKGAGRIEALQFIRDSGNEGVIKQELQIPAEETEGAMTILADHGVNFEVAETIHPMTLKSLVSELLGIKEGSATRYTVDELPKGLGVYVERKVKMK